MTSWPIIEYQKEKWHLEFFFTFSSLIQIYQLIFGNKKFRHINATKSSIIYHWVFGQWLTIPLASTCLLTCRPLSHWSVCMSPSSQVWWGVSKVGYPPAGVPPARSDGGTWGGVPLPWQGYPLDRSDQGYPRWSTPWQRYPQPGLTGGYSRWSTPQQDTPWPGLTGGTWGGVPLGRSTPTKVPPGTPTRVPRVPPCQVWWGTQDGVPLHPLAWVPLARSDGWYPRWGTPWEDLAGVPPSGQTDQWIDGWTDTCENITFPSYYVRGR